MQQAELNLVDLQPVLHARLQQINIPWHEVGDTHAAHLAACDQPVQAFAKCTGVHQRVGAVNQQQIDNFYANALQRTINAGSDVRRCLCQPSLLF